MDEHSTQRNLREEISVKLPCFVITLLPADQAAHTVDDSVQPNNLRVLGPEFLRGGLWSKARRPLFDVLQERTLTGCHDLIHPKRVSGGRRRQSQRLWGKARVFGDPVEDC